MAAKKKGKGKAKVRQGAKAKPKKAAPKPKKHEEILENHEIPDNKTGLTGKQERFAQLIAAGMNQSSAYRAAYDAKRMKDEVVRVEAYRLAAHPNITLRVNEIRAPVIEQVRYTLKEAMDEAKTVLAEALALGQTGAAASAVALRSKLNGLLVEDRQNDRPPFSDYTDDELDRAADATERAIAQAQGQETGVTEGKAAPA